MKATPSGASMRPSIPERKNNGTKLAIMMSVEFKIGIRTSFDASKTTVIIVFCSSSGFCLFSLNRLNTFSTSTMASSTSAPMAIAIPPKLMVFMVNPINLRESIAKTNESGIVISDIIVVRAFIKKIINTITTKNPPSYMDFFTLSIELSMKRA